MRFLIGSRSTAVRGFTLIELLVVLAIIGLMVGLLLPGLSAARLASQQLKDATQLVGTHQVMILYAESNRTRLPGLDSNGSPFLESFGTASPNINSTLVSSRYWILLQGAYITPSLPLSSSDIRTAWVNGPVTTSNFSHAMLSIGDGDSHQDRIADWRDNANSRAIMISDRAGTSSVADALITSPWTALPGKWQGNVVWGDNHAELQLSNRGLTTQYASTVTTNDNLFADAAAAGLTENGISGSNALMVTTSLAGTPSPSVFTYYRDNDNDGYGDPSNTTTSATGAVPLGYTSDNTDQDDNNPLVH
ncbi:MAG: type II secretion system protein [Planctomycetota bacterium]|nr:type II secretion system protein [Planctomycetota bacterium]